MASSGANNRTRKGKTKIEEVEEKSKRNVTFSKRKLGLYNKLTEISLLCQVETALIIKSQNGKLFTCGYPSADAVVHRYLARGSTPWWRNRSRKKESQGHVEKQRVEYEAVQNQLKEEKQRLQNMIGERNKSGLCFPPWWNLNTEKMSLEDLEEFKNSLECLKCNLAVAMQEKQLNSVAPQVLLPTNIVPQTSRAIVPPMHVQNCIVGCRELPIEGRRE